MPIPGKKLSTDWRTSKQMREVNESRMGLNVEGKCVQHYMPHVNVIFRQISYIRFRV